MIKILFVCHGNICRSPMAEFIMKDIVEKNKASHLFEIASCATSCEEIGNPVYPPARKKLAEEGISCDGKTARQITKEDYEYFDYVIAMDNNNLKNLSRIIDDDEKVSLLMEYVGENREVSDPWYTGDFEKAYRDIKKGCEALFKKLHKI